mmetsp:Transcript_2579/g.8095  ORF Transcript_2579/g.8095 Transcript_2579/m.8095 type:complete len:627 (+) Transcript_2579:87-1967(+)
MADTGGRASRSDRKEQLRQKRLLEEEKRRTAFSGPSEIKREEFTQDEIISKSGAFGEVWAGVCRGTPVAVKIPKKKKRLTKKEFESFLDEVSVMKSALHTNLCLFMGACYEPVNDTSGTLYIVMERLTGDLDTLLLPRDEASLVDVKKRFSLSVRLNWATQAARGLAWLHGMGILHRDIKLNNILYDNEHHIKVCDFGLAQFEAQHDSDSSKATGLRGSPFKMAPELFKDGTTPTAKSDVWSFAVTLWEMLKSETAYSKLIQEKTGKTCASSFADYFDVVIDQGNRMTIPEEWPAELNTLLTSCWDADPENRPPMCEVLTQLTACEAKAKNLENVRALQAEIKNFHGDNPILFWLKRFFPKQKVPWPEFIEGFFDFLKLPLPTSHTDGKAPTASELHTSADSDDDAILKSYTYSGSVINADTPLEKAFHALELLFTETSPRDVQRVVSAKRFSFVVAAFGPLKPELSTAESNPFIDRVLELASQEYFHGWASSSESEKKLYIEPRGAFLVRMSGSTLGSFCISKLNRHGRVSHLVIQNRPSLGFRLDLSTEAYWPSIPLLLNPETCEHYHLQKAVGKSPFAWIFVDQSCSSEAYAALESEHDYCTDDTLNELMTQLELETCATDPA